LKGRRCEEVTGTVVKGMMGEIVKEGKSEGDKSIRCEVVNKLSGEGVKL
jgi:hypothetical protein